MQRGQKKEMRTDDDDLANSGGTSTLIPAFVKVVLNENLKHNIVFTKTIVYIDHPMHNATNNIS